MRKKGLIIILFLVFLFTGPASLKGIIIEIPWYVIYGGDLSQFANPWAEGIIVDEKGNVYTTGTSYLWDPSVFGLPLHMLTLGMYQSAFVAKWNKKGNLIWYTLLGSSYWDYGRGIDLNKDGNVYVTGSSFSAWDTSLFGIPVIPHNISGIYYDGFVARLDPSGVLLWYTFLGGSGADNHTAIDVTGGGNVVVTGESQDVWNTGIFGPPLIDYNTPGSYGSDITVARLNKSGDLQWYTFLGGDDYQYPSSVKITSGGDIFVTGETLLYWPEFKYGRPILDKLVDDQFDGILAKLSSSGIFQWYTFLGEDTTVYPMSIDYSQSGRLFLAGTKFDFPNIISSVSSSRSGNSPDTGNGIFLSFNKLYVASYSLSGEKLWAKTPFVTNYSTGLSIDTGPLGDIFVSGSGTDSLPFIPLAGTKADLLPLFKQYAYVLNMDQSGNKKWLHIFTKKPFSSGDSVAAFNNGITYVTGSNWGGIFIVSSLGSTKNGAIIPGYDPDLFLVKINNLYVVETIVKNDGGSIEQAVYEIVPGKDAVINIFPDPGYEIDKLIDNEQLVETVNPYVIVNVNEDHFVDVYFRLIQFPPELILSGVRTSDSAWIIKKEFADLTATIVEHQTSPMDVKSYNIYKYVNGEWKIITGFTGPGTYKFADKFLTPGVEEKYILKAIAPDGSVVAESDILIL